jgi:hypothetical protein
MNTLTKSLLASVALGGLLAGCASYDYDGAYGYSYGYGQPYGYTTYDYGPYYYGYGSYYPSYAPAWYGPSAGLDFRFRDRGRSYRGNGRHAGNGRGDRHHGANDHRFHAQNRGGTHPAHVANRQQHNRATGTRVRVPPAAPPQRARAGHRAAPPAQTASRNEQQ